MSGTTLAEALRSRDAEAVAAVASQPLAVRPDNLVPRPWGGRRLFAWKGIQAPAGEEAYGESFEVSGDRRDPESAAHPSVMVLADGSEVTLPDLLDAVGREVLGDALFGRHGPNLPLLPKVLDIRQLLSLQAHPPGSPEAYYVLEAAPGATLRIGFVRDLQPETLQETFEAGREAQESILELLAPGVDAAALQRAVAPALQAGGGPDALVDAVRPLLAPPGEVAVARTLLSCLAGARRQTLDLLTAVPAVPGRMLFNATPAEAGANPSAEVHALGNPEGLPVLLFEVRRPAPTFRAWDHVRFPLRDLEIERALGALALAARSAASFEAPPVPVAGRPGAFRTVTCPAFAVDHLRPSGGQAVALPADATVRTLHVVAGGVVLRDKARRPVLRLARGHAAVLPAGVGPLEVGTLDADEVAEALVVSIPEPEAA